MSQDITPIVDAIKSLKQNPDYIKDYIYPIAIVIVSSFFGWFIGIISFFGQEFFTILKYQYDAINKWILKAENAYTNLIAIKFNYQNRLEDTKDPIQRIAGTPEILMSHVRSIETDDIINLSFLIPSKKDNSSEKWGNIIIIRDLFDNYNAIMETWRIRNDALRLFRKDININYPNKPLNSITYEEALEYTDKNNIIELIDLTETCVRQTDELIFELGNFLSEFPKYAKDYLDKRLTRKYLNKYLLNSHHRILTHRDTEDINKLKIPCKSPDFDKLSSETGRTISELKQFYGIGYISFW